MQVRFEFLNVKGIPIPETEWNKLPQPPYRVPCEVKDVRFEDDGDEQLVVTYQLTRSYEEGPTS